jgi:hypothetical protein
VDPRAPSMGAKSLCSFWSRGDPGGNEMYPSSLWAEGAKVTALRM